MLGNLVKHEIQSAGRLMSVVYGVIGLAALLALGIYWLLRPKTVCIFGVIIYVITMIVMFVTSYIYMCFRFYQTMYTAQGYLTHTLPVRTSQILNVKILVSFGYMLLTVAVCALSATIVGAVITGEGPGAAISVLQAALQEMAQEFGMGAQIVCAFLLATAVLSFLSSLLMCFAGCSIGQLFHRSKGAYGIGAIIVLYYLTQIIMTIVVAVTFLFTHTHDLMFQARWFMCVSISMMLLINIT